MGNRIEIEDGSKVYDICNKRGEILGQFTFIPSDFDVVRRYEETVVAFESMQEEFKEKESVDLECIRQIEQKMGEKIDYLFNASVSENFFSITSPFTLMDDGRFFVENVIDSIRKLIELERGERLKAVENRMNEYTNKYKIGPGGHILTK